MFVLLREWRRILLRRRCRCRCRCLTNSSWNDIRLLLLVALLL